MSEEVVQIATLKSEVKTLTEAVRELTLSMQKNNERLERLAVLEVSHNNSNHAIERAFEAIQKVERAESERAEANSGEHKAYDKVIWLSFGFITAVSIFWTVFGYKVSGTLDDVLKTSAQMQLHIQQDKVMSESDVIKLYKGSQ